MKKIFLLYIFFTCTFWSYAQDTLTELWRTLEYVEGYGIKGPTIQQDKYFNTYMVTNQLDEASFTGVTLVKYDTLGNQLWKQSFAQPQGIPLGFLYGGFTVDSLGSVYLSYVFDAGTGWDADALMVKYSPEGDILWQQNYGIGQSGSNGVYFSALDQYGRLIALGLNRSFTVVEDNFFTLTCIDTATGIEIWRKEISGNFWCQNLKLLDNHIEVLMTEYKPEGTAYRIDQFTYDGAFASSYNNLYTGHQIDFNYINDEGEVYLGNRAWAYTLTKLDIKGDTLWRYEEPGSSGISYNKSLAFVEDSFKNVYVTGGIYNDQEITEAITTKFSKTGELLWQTSFNLDEEALFNVGADIASDDQFVYVTGSSQKQDESQVLFILVYNKISGEEEYKIILSGSKRCSGREIVVSNNRIYYTGPSYNPTTSMSTNIITGCIQLPDLISDIPEIMNGLHIGLYPNPATERIIISNMNTSLFEVMEIADAQGRVLSSAPVIMESAVIDLAQYLPGTYVLTLRGKGTTLSKKIVKSN